VFIDFSSQIHLIAQQISEQLIEQMYQIKGLTFQTTLVSASVENNQ
jgi:hypothetical protein